MSTFVSVLSGVEELGGSDLCYRPFDRGRKSPKGRSEGRTFNVVCNRATIGTLRTVSAYSVVAVNRPSTV